jgi:hypothetical protein
MNTLQRARRLGDYGRPDLEQRFISRVRRRIAACLGITISRLAYDWHDNSFEVYGCSPADRLTESQYNRIFSTGLGILFMNSDRQCVVYTWFRKAPDVRVTDLDAWRKPLT